MATASPGAHGYLNDLPAVPPRFDFDLIGVALAEMLVEPGDGATVIGIHGPWGSGKTTLMYAVRDALKARLPGSALVVVDFNAWKYHGREALWRALILRVVGELRRHQVALAKLPELEQSLYKAFEVEEAGPWSINWRSAAIEFASVLLEVLQLGAVGKLIRRIVGRRSKADEDGGIIGVSCCSRGSVNAHFSAEVAGTSRSARASRGRSVRRGCESRTRAG